MTAPRGVGLGTAAFPDAAVYLAALLTQLGDLWFVFVLLAGLYWFDGPATDRRRMATLVGVTLTALALTTGLKALFGLPRPAGAAVAERADLFPALVRPLYENAATGDGFGFPSGHALGATVVYGGLALLTDAFERRHRLLAGGAVVGVVMATRVVLGVHFLVDVLAGAVGGLAVLGAGYYVTAGWERPTRAFSLALAAGLFAALVAGYTADAMAVLGATLGARIAWGAVGNGVLALPAADRRDGVVSFAVGLPAFGGVFVGTYLLEPAPWVNFLANAVVLAGVLALPLAVER